MLLFCSFNPRCRRSTTPILNLEAFSDARLTRLSVSSNRHLLARRCSMQPARRDTSIADYAKLTIFKSPETSNSSLPSSTLLFIPYNHCCRQSSISLIPNNCPSFIYPPSSSKMSPSLGAILFSIPLFLFAPFPACAEATPSSPASISLSTNSPTPQA